MNREPSLNPRQQDVDEEERTKASDIERSHKHLQVAVRAAFDTVRVVPQYRKVWVAK